MPCARVKVRCRCAGLTASSDASRASGTLVPPAASMRARARSASGSLGALRPAAPASAEAALLGVSRRGEELDPVPSRPSRRAARPAIDARRPHRVDEPAVGAGIAGFHCPPGGAGIEGALHGAHVSEVRGGRLPESCGQTGREDVKARGRRGNYLPPCPSLLSFRPSGLRSTCTIPASASSTPPGTSPAMNRDPRREFREGHIPGAQLFSIDDASDPSSPLPHMLPPAAQFADVVSRLGISSGDHVVVYDASGTNFSAPRVWWMFRAFGHDAVSRARWRTWRVEGRGAARSSTASTSRPPRGAFHAVLRPAMMRSAAQVLELTAAANARRWSTCVRAAGSRAPSPSRAPAFGAGTFPAAGVFPMRSLVDGRGLLRRPAELRAHRRERWY